RTAAVPDAVRALCGLPVCDPRRRARSEIVAAAPCASPGDRRAAAGDRQLPLSRAILRCAGRDELCPGASGERPARAGGLQMNGGRTDRKIDAAWLREGPLPRLLAVLDRDGEEARVIGGAVRNALLGEPVHEYDVATTAVPEEVVRRVTAAGFKAVPTGIAHGTVTVVIDRHPFEVTTLRLDVETYGRYAKVEFGRDWAGDAHRRDFTINALSVTADGSIHDYTNGLADLAARRVRFIGEAKTRIAEDYLRILRFFRFHAAYGLGDPDRDGLSACVEGRAGLDQLSRERVRMEMMKFLLAARATPTLAVMGEVGLLLRVLGGVPYLATFEMMSKVEA